MSAWESFFREHYPAELALDELRQPGAAAMAALLSSGAYGGAELIECRGGNSVFPEACLLIIDVEVGLGQRRVVNDIKPVERMAFAYTRSDLLPSVCALRDGFPIDVPHLNLTARDQPRSLCLFEMPAEEALRLATPFVLIERVRFWLKETAYGRLHGDDQPLDPVFATGWQPLVLPPKEPTSEHSDLFYGYMVGDHDRAPIILEAATQAEVRHRLGMSAIVVITKPVPHARLRMVPLNMADLLEAFDSMGVDLLSDLQSVLRTWPSKPRLENLVGQPCLIIIRTPIERSPGKIGGEAAKAFLITHCAAGAFAEKLAAFYESDGFFGRLARPPEVDLEALRKVALIPMDVYRPFDRQVALAASGAVGDSSAPLAITLVGAGALGSQFAFTAARMGLGSWTIVDPDHLLPHNMARHALSPLFVGWAKAEAVTREIKRLLGDNAAEALVGRIDGAPQAEQVLSGASLVVDASASVPTARWLATASNHPGRTASVFLNPTGNDLVILAEGDARTPRLDHVEMSYYWALMNDAAPSGHLFDGRVGLYPSGGCRTPSLTISQADVGTLTPFAVKRLLQDAPPANGAIEIWRASTDGVNVFRASPTAYREASLGEWTIAVSTDLIQGVVDDSREASPLETGGILVGTWDRARKRVYIVGHYAPPPDSVLETCGFVRGAAGVYQTLEAVQRRTAGNLTYIGEWHTHPPGHRSQPSAHDRVLLRWIGHVLVYLDVPALMLIAGEDGVRVVVGSGGESVLFACEPPEAACQAA